MNRKQLLQIASISIATLLMVGCGEPKESTPESQLFNISINVAAYSFSTAFVLSGLLSMIGVELDKKWRIAIFALSAIGFTIYAFVSHGWALPGLK